MKPIDSAQFESRRDGPRPGTVRIGNAIFPLVPARQPKPKRLRYVHVSAPIVEVTMPDKTVERRVASGTTYNVGRNVAKRANRQADARKAR